MSPAHYRREGEDLILACHVQPGAKTSAFAGLHDGRLKIRIAAPAVDSKANQQLLQFLAGAFDVALRDVTLLSGDTQRRKTVRIGKPGHLPPGCLVDQG